MTKWLMCCWLLLSVLTCLVSVTAFAQSRHIDMIVDTSSSMLTSDQQRYTLQLAKIIADLLGKDDSLTIVRLPKHERSCHDGADFGLAQKMDVSNRSGFQKKLASLLVYDTGNYFSAPIYTAKADLEKHREKSRLLLFLADSGGLGSCDAELNRELAALKADGVMIAAINLGGLGAFDANPAFSFTVSAQDAEAMVKAVAEVYQKFIGSKQVQTGRVRDTLEVDINPLTRQAFLVVAADGQLQDIEALAGNPAAEYIDLNHQGGGQTVGLDKKRRDYRIVRLQRPTAGRWRFKVTGLTDKAGWMLLQDSALGLRPASSPKRALGVDAPVEVELYDQDTGKRVANTDGLAGLEAAMTVDGKTISLHDDGKDGDSQAGDGIFSTVYAFKQLGKQRIPLRLSNDFLDRRTDIDVQVEKIDWLLQPQIPAQIEVGSPALLSVKAQANDHTIPPTPLQAIEVKADGKLIATLKDNGQNGDKKAGDNEFTAVWTAQDIGDYVLSFNPVGGSGAQSVDNISLKVAGSIKFGPAIPVKLGITASNSELKSKLDLSNTAVKGEFPLEISSQYDFSGSILEIDFGQGWLPLNAKPQTFTISQSSPHTWPLRLRVGDCPSPVSEASGLSIQIEGLNADNQRLRLSVPLSVVVLEDPWLHCWWPILAMLIAALLITVVCYGFWSPSRFSTRLGVVLSPEEDMNEGFFYPIKAERGTGSGFYKDARAYICQDFRLSGKAKGALARLRASGKRVYLSPAHGMAVYRQNLEGEWDELPTEETLMHFGVIYKNALGTLFFELRNR